MPGDIVSSSLSALPIGELIAAPLTAAIQAQASAAMSSVEFIRSVGFGDDNKTIMVDFIYSKIKPDGTAGTATLSVPLLTIVNVPFIRILDMTIDFDFKIHQVETRDLSSTKNASLSTSAGGKFFGIGAKTELKGSYSRKEDVKSSLERTATLKITVRAAQDEMPAGLHEVLDMLKEAIKETVA
jgi:hypothetical protein